jgi:hypothetical protein
MLSPKSKPSAGNNSLVCDFDLPVFEEPMVEHWPRAMAWVDVIRHFAPLRAYYMKHFDSAEKRWQDKNPEPFRLP